MVNVIDNSGAAVAECVKVLKMKRHAKVGDKIIVVVQKQRNFGPESGPGGSVSVSAANKVRRGDIRHAVVVRTAKKYQRPDGSVVKFDDNACVLVNKGGEPIGSRLSGVVGREIREKGWSKILSLAPMHL
ncbi:54S ribosomal protein L38, mitochondrial [Recurvomyces mirabilis]|uniref:Large ribosomal subunit protein uL14m n=1 Tax=Recurvomyces mirabilis TaxID=574656 RepID=A0AAE0TUZ2_9PEZI|nr:54S ribosomal protein L38, mitochondrial [Recurvomyces mirabilis]KAK4561617.1 54S ribosomal protein L38, mitochondrial [Recurvomyces mirabilis]KAK5150676.1 54S ribosomal protein L38, mitochondrial [Recurvomyces mirabilis]